MANFMEKVLEAREVNQSDVWVGLDINPDKMPKVYRNRYCFHQKEHSYREQKFVRQDLEASVKQAEIIFAFAKHIIDATKDLCAGYKIQAAYIEAMGVAGEIAVRWIVNYILENTDVPVSYDAKRGDIDATAVKYALAILEENTGKRFEALTTNIYMGEDAIIPFTKYKNKGVIVLCRPSNPSAEEMVKVKLENGEYYFEFVARKAVELNENGNVGLVIGAVAEHLPKEDIESLRRIAGDLLALVPGIGAQLGFLEATIKAIIGKKKDSPFAIHSARGITHASSGSDYKEKANKACFKLRKDINDCLLQYGYLR